MTDWPDRGARMEPLSNPPAPRGIGRGRVVDVHTHPSLTQWFLDRDLARPHRAPAFWNPFPSRVDVPRAREGGVDVLFSMIFVPRLPFFQNSYAETARKMLLKMEAFIRRHPAAVETARSYRDIDRIVSAGKMAWIHAIEGGHALEHDLDNLSMFAEMGVRYLTLTHDFNNDIAAAATHPRLFRCWDGLSPFGKRVVRRMNELRLIIDVSHITEKGFWAVMEATSAPVLASHMGVQKMARTERNLSDEQVRAIARTGGMIGIILWPWLMRTRGLVVGIHKVFDTIAHIASLVGSEHVCIGSDLDGMIWVVRGIRDIRDLRSVAQGLRDRGFTEREVQGIMGENFLRFFRRVREE